MANGVELATAYVSLAISGQDVGPQTRKALGVVDKEADRTGKSAGKRLSGGIGGALKGMGPLFAGVLAGIGFGAVTAGLKDVIGEAREAQKVGALTRNVIKQTGGAAKVTEKQVSDLAAAISNKTGIDDEAVQTGANLLLTFKNVKNEVGSGSKVFDRATQAAVDLSASGFGSVEGTSKMLGKALNDPLKGLTALGKAGVTFTAGQKKQIEGMVEVGDVLGAQKIILAEVESQVGGSAAATATAGDKVKVAFGNIKESIGTALLPILDRLGNWFLEKGLPAIQRFGGWITENLWPALKDGYDTIMPGLSKALEIVTGGVGDGSFSFEKLGKIITEKVIPFIAKLISVYLPYVALQMRVVVEVIKGLWKAFQTWRDIAIPVIATIVRTFLGMVGAIVNGAAKAFGWVPGLGPKLKTAAKEFNKFKDGVNGALDKIEGKTVTVGVKFSAGSKITSGGKSYNAGMVGLAAGGRIPGPWRGPTADNVLGVSDSGVPVARVNPREYITRVWATDRMERNNPGALAYINKYGELPGRANGGLAVASRFPSRKGVNEATDSATLDLVARNLKSLTSALGGGPGMGWRAQVAWAKANVPWAAITSTVRSGNPASDHDKGRAIDLAGPNMGRTFDTIKAAFGVSNIRSLYYSPKGNRQVRFNRESNTPPHIFRTHGDHNHWAMNQGGRVPVKPTLYDNGGILKPGTTLVQNNTGRDEYVTPPREKREKSTTPQDYYDAIYDAVVDANSGKARRLVASRRAG